MPTYLPYQIPTNQVIFKPIVYIPSKKLILKYKNH